MSVCIVRLRGSRPVDVVVIEAEIAATILQEHSRALRHDAEPKSNADALDERNQVSVLVGGAEIDGVPPSRSPASPTAA